MKYYLVLGVMLVSFSWIRGAESGEPVPRDSDGISDSRLCVNSLLHCRSCRELRELAVRELGVGKLPHVTREVAHVALYHATRSLAEDPRT